MRTTFFLSISIIVLFIASCKKEEVTPTPTEKGTVTVQLDHIWGMGSDAFALNTELVHPMNLDTMTFTTFKYYISNFKLKKADGSWWKHPESYFLVNLSDESSTSLSIPNVPVGDYTEMEYTLGVDSTKNVSGTQSGALSTANGMFWNWNSGYIMIKAEGTSPQSGTGSFAFHLGGFSGSNNIVNVKNISFSANNLTVSKTNQPTVFIVSNPAKLFHADPLSSGTAVMMPGTKAKQMATNYYSSFMFDHLEE